MNRSAVIFSLVMLGVGLGGGYWLSASYGHKYASGQDAPMTQESGSHEQSSDGQGKILFYRSPMNPSVTSPVPAKDAMGMDYVPVYADSGQSQNEAAGTVRIDPVIVQNIGVRTAVAKRTSISRAIRAAGRVAFNEESMVNIHPKVEGWIEQVRVDKTGQNVKKNEILLSIYSPKLVSTQQEYLLALDNMKTLNDSPFEDIKRGAQNLVNSSRQRLQLFDVPEHQILALEKSGKVKKSLHIHSPVAGTAIRVGVRQGQHVMPNTELYMLVNLEKVWVFADVYEYELPWIKAGDKAQMTLASVPGKVFTGTLDYIYPYAEAKTRTTQVRLIFDNPDSQLRPDMLADVTINADTQLDVVVIPAEAVIRSGDQPQVFVVREPGKFEPRLVRLGIESKGKVAVLEGVEAGEEVLTSAQFLVDSESKLREATSKMLERQGMGSSSMNMPTDDMSTGDTTELQPRHSDKNMSKERIHD